MQTPPLGVPGAVVTFDQQGLQAVPNDSKRDHSKVRGQVLWTALFSI